MNIAKNNFTGYDYVSYLTPGVKVCVEVYTNDYDYRPINIDSAYGVSENAYYEPRSRHVEGKFISFLDGKGGSCKVALDNGELLATAVINIRHVVVPIKNGKMLIGESSIAYLDDHDRFHRLDGPAKEFFKNEAWAQYWIDGVRYPSKDVYQLTLFTLLRRQVHV